MKGKKAKRAAILCRIARFHRVDPFAFTNIGLWAASGAISMTEWALYLAALREHRHTND